jgi:hypothetical protein
LRPTTLLLWFVLASPAVAQVSPEALPDNSTCRFLGPRQEWASVAVVFHEIAPLAGAQEFYIQADGSIVSVEVTLTKGGARERRHVLRRPERATLGLIEQLCRGDVLSESRNRRRDTTCGGAAHLFVVNATGETRTVEFARKGPEGRRRAWLALADLVDDREKSAPTHDGAYEPDYLPLPFEWWARDLLRPWKNYPFGRVAGHDELRRSLRDAGRPEGPR